MSRLRDVYVIDAIRTPIGRRGGILASLSLEHLLAPLISHLITSNSIESEHIDEVIVGNAAGPGGNPARLAALQSGLPVSVPGMTVDRQCGSGLEAINIGARLIQCGAAELVIAGGAESSSTAPLRAHPGTARSHDAKIDKSASIQSADFYQRARFSPADIGDPDMGVAAEAVASRYDVSRARQDQFALLSHQKTVAANNSGFFASERHSLDISGKMINFDECPRPNTSLQALAALEPAFVEGGTVTAGNACPVNDGASLVLLAPQPLPGRRGLTFLDACAAGVDPNILGIGPVPAVQGLMKKTDTKLDDVDQIEFNEAFAAQVIACMDELKIEPSRVNTLGGALALGHPYGASGAMLVTRLFHQLVPGRLGLATLGIGGGLGLASLFRAYD